MQCEEILKLIRAMKTYNVNTVRVGDLLLERGEGKDVDIKAAPQQGSVTQLSPAEQQEQHALQEELQEIEDENLLISDPEEYEKRVGNV